MRCVPHGISSSPWPLEFPTSPCAKASSRMSPSMRRHLPWQRRGSNPRPVEIPQVLLFKHEVGKTDGFRGHDGLEVIEQRGVLCDRELGRLHRILTHLERAAGRQERHYHLGVVRDVRLLQELNNAAPVDSSHSLHHVLISSHPIRTTRSLARPRTVVTAL